MKPIRTVLLVLLFFVTLSASDCDRAPKAEDTAQTAPASAEFDPVHAGSDFGFDLFRILTAERPDENTVISPWSIQSALLLVSEGAEGSSFREIVTALRASGPDKAEMRKVYAETAKLLSSGAGGATFRSANAFFYDPDRIDPEQGFMNTARGPYGAEVITRDFSSPDAPGAVNAWVAEQTEGKIEQVIERITPEQAAFILNALYFRADWADGFPEDFTRFSAFTCSDGTVAEAAMMQRDGSVRSAEVDGFVAVEMAFADSLFTLTAIRPKVFIPGDAASLKKIDRGLLEKLDTAMQPGRVMLRLPKTELKFGESLIPNLKSMGVKDAFSEANADFSSLGTAARGNFYIDLLRHDAVLVIDERGAEGAAVTTVGIGATSMPPEITFDVPYAMVLRHAETGAVLFLAQVNRLGTAAPDTE